MSSDRSLALLEFSLWVLAATALVVTVVVPLGVLIGGDLVAAKFGLFVVGVLVFGAGSLAIQPEGPDLEGSIYDPDEVDDANRDRATSDILGGGLSGLRGLGQGPDDQPGVETSVDERDGPSGFEERIQNIGPLADHDLPRERRIGRRYKIFATGLAVLAVSFLLEVAGVSI